MKKTKRFIITLLAVLMLSAISLPTALAMDAFGFLRPTPVSQAGIRREAYFGAHNNSSFTKVAGVQLTQVNVNGAIIQQTSVRTANYKPYESKYIYSMTLVSLMPGWFYDHGGRV